MTGGGARFAGRIRRIQTVLRYSPRLSRLDGSQAIKRLNTEDAEDHWSTSEEGKAALRAKRKKLVFSDHTIANDAGTLCCAKW